MTNLLGSMNMRELTGHKVNGVNDGITITVVDDPGHGGANHKYQARLTIECPDGISGCETLHFKTIDIDFQNGTIPEVGVNGLTHEVLLVILIDRLEGFQRGKFACAANEIALNHCREALRALLERTKERAARRVEGTHKV